MPPSNIVPLHLMVHGELNHTNEKVIFLMIANILFGNHIMKINTLKKKKENLCREKRDNIETYSHCLTELTPQP